MREKIKEIMHIREKKNPLIYKINQLPPELQNYFIIRWIVTALFLTAVIITFIFAGLHKSLFVIPIGILAYAGYMTFDFVRVLSGNLIMIQGICESKDNKHFKVSIPLFKKSIFEYYGKSSITIIMDDKKFIVPVGHNFSVKEGQTIRVYSFPDEVYPNSDNSFRINNPLLVKLIKI